MSSQPAVLVADDDANDVFFLRRAFQKAGYSCPMLEVPDGERAICYLNGSDGFADRNRLPIPSLLFLDVKIPNVSVVEVLDWLEEHHNLATMELVVLRSSNLPGDVQHAGVLD